MAQHNFAIIGAGLMGKRRAEALSGINGCSIVAIVDNDKERADSLAKIYGAKAYYNTKDLFDNAEGIDSVVVCTITSEIYAISKETASAGLNVLAEKPLTIWSKEVEDLSSIARHNNVTVKVGFNHRYLPNVVHAIKLLKQGTIGKLIRVDARYGQKSRIGFEKEWRAKKEFALGGILSDQGVHLIDLFHMISPRFSVKNAECYNLYWDAQVEDSAYVHLTDENNVPFSLYTSGCLWENTFRLEMQGTIGIIRAIGIRGHYGAPKVEILTRNEEKSNEIGVYQFDREVVEFPDKDESFFEDTRDFVSLLENNLPGNLDELHSVISILEECYRSKDLEK